MAKDVITHVDDQPIRDVSLQEAIDLLRGPLGSTVELGIVREVQGKAEELTVALERAVIRVTSVRQEMLPHGVGYLRISQFQNRTGPDLIKAIGNLKAQGQLNGLILDLRNNPGGVLSAAIEVVDAFIDEGLIVSTKGRDALKLTTALYYTPNGRSIQATGIQPTIQVSGGEALIESDTRVREADLPKHVENAGAEDITSERVVDRLTKDNQLLHAYNLLRGAQLLAR